MTKWNDPINNKPIDNERVIIELGDSISTELWLARYDANRDSYFCTNGAYACSEYHPVNFECTSNANRVQAWASIERWSGEFCE